jgi:oligopeptidase B
MLEPPRPQARPVDVGRHGRPRIDEYFWLRHKDDPEVIKHLEAENAYADEVLAHTKALEDRLYDEIIARIQETDLSVPAKDGGFWYYRRTEEGRQYPIYCRRQSSEDGPEEVVLDQNALAEGYDYLVVGVLAVSPDHRLLAYGVDTDGSERYTIRFRDLETGAELPDVITGAYYGSAWANDNRTFFYTTPDDAMRPWRMVRHVLGAPLDDDVILYQEDDERFFLSLGTTRSHRFVMVLLHSHMTTEVRFLPAHEPMSELHLLRARVHGVEYHADHQGERFVIVTNEDAENFKIVEAPLDEPTAWRDLLSYDPAVRIADVDAFADHLVITERAGGTLRLRVLRVSDGDAHVVEQSEEIGTVGVGENREYDTTVVRFGYTSLVTPQSVIDYDLNTRARELKKQEPVLGDFDPARYETTRLWATASDGTLVPISLVARRGLARDGTNPLLLYGYGSYEACIDPAFSSLRLSLLDRGVVFAIAHPRGGGEMGRRWYEDGKLLQKRNTFTDFVACAEHLVAEGWTAPARLVARGRSAGGLLAGAISNLAPELFAGVSAEVPFVDVVSTMLDETIPLTVPEWEEWGNPSDEPHYDYMLSYSPYDNVEAKAYPRMYITGGLNDPRVAYWEPAKWAARLRDRKTDGHPVVLKTEMGAGHMGPAGRYDAWRKEAQVYAFVLDVVGITE